MKIPIALSWSRLSSYLECPMKFKAQYIDKSYPDDSDNPHFARGSRIHKQLEHYINYLNTKSGQIQNPPAMSAESQNVVPIIDKIHNQCDTMTPERQIATNMSWDKCDWFDKPDVVKYRCIVDSLAVYPDFVTSLDFKTGKVRPYDSDHGQLHLSAAMILNVMPNMEKIINSYLFVDHKQSITITLHRKDLQKEMDYFDEQYEKVNSDEEFKPTKHKYCGFCLIKDKCPLFKKGV